MTAQELTEMLEAAMTVINSDAVSQDTSRQANDCVQSLLKSMAGHGFNVVQESKQ